MVTLSRLYTKTGDGGLTRLGDMSQVPKTSARIAAYGCVDELNSVIGLARCSGAGPDEVLARVQNDLFDVGADLCVPRHGRRGGASAPAAAAGPLPGEADR